MQDNKFVDADPPSDVEREVAILDSKIEGNRALVARINRRRSPPRSARVRAVGSLLVAVGLVCVSAGFTTFYWSQADSESLLNLRRYMVPSHRDQVDKGFEIYIHRDRVANYIVLAGVVLLIVGKGMRGPFSFLRVISQSNEDNASGPGAPV